MIIWIQHPKDNSKLLIMIGNYSIQNHPNGESVWIEDRSGEALQLSNEKLEQWLEKLWHQEF